MAMFLLHLPSEMRDHLIAKDFKDCTLMAEYADLMNSSRASCTIAGVNMEYEAAISVFPAAATGSSCPTTSGEKISPRPAKGAAARRPPRPHKEDSEICYYQTTYSEKAKICKPGCLWTGNGLAAGS
jgi:hypothetical protein